MWLAIKKPKRFSTNWFVNWVSKLDNSSPQFLWNNRNIQRVKSCLTIIYDCFVQASIFVGVFIMLASTIGGLRNIVTDASTYRFYTWIITKLCHWLDQSTKLIYYQTSTWLYQNTKDLVIWCCHLNCVDPVYTNLPSSSSAFSVGNMCLCSSKSSERSILISFFIFELKMSSNMKFNKQYNDNMYVKAARKCYHSGYTKRALSSHKNTIKHMD